MKNSTLSALFSFEIACLSLLGSNGFINLLVSLDTMFISSIILIASFLITKSIEEKQCLIQ